eukprot:1323253-Karenia_brevis.AAC.1
MSHSFAGGQLFDDEHDFVTVSAPKIEEEQLDFGVATKAAVVRPLGMENCSLKIMFTSVNGSTMWHLKAKACGVQRGFLHGRHFTDSFLFLDTRAIVNVDTLTQLLGQAVQDFPNKRMQQFKAGSVMEWT